MRRFHFLSQFAHISPSDGIKNFLRKAEVKLVFETFLNTAHGSDVSGHGFTFYAQSCVGMEVFMVIIDFYE